MRSTAQCRRARVVHDGGKLADDYRMIAGWGRCVCNVRRKRPENESIFKGYRVPRRSLRQPGCQSDLLISDHWLRRRSIHRQSCPGPQLEAGATLRQIAMPILGSPFLRVNPVGHPRRSRSTDNGTIRPTWHTRKPEHHRSEEHTSELQSR